MSLWDSASSQTDAEEDYQLVPEDVPENFFENIYEKGEFLELNDLCSPDTSSASSDNFIRAAVNSDEYFDPDDFLRVIENDHGYLSSPTRFNP